MHLSFLLLSFAASLLPHSTASPLRLPRQLSNVLTLDFNPSSAIGISNKDYLCPAQDIHFTGLNPPFNLDVIVSPYDSTNLTNQNLLVHLGTLTGDGTATWETDKAALTLGQHLVVRLQDGAGNVRYSSERWIDDGNKSTCVFVPFQSRRVFPSSVDIFFFDTAIVTHPGGTRTRASN
jgi:hypothetical protein